ncbi:MAG: threonine--tRNA ligase [Candidatus Omnitrophica bacterium]|nr:threonine--tRNA ligase [Candidatus Omnitrophota bacterium]MCM8826927.1 threonine--tRNA ligase [Candidatus Omnitrophota bacterium]
MNLETLRHSCSHIMASAVKKLYPNAKLGIGPAIENGFYYDFEIPQGIKEDDLDKIEDLMREIIYKDYPFIHEMWEKDKAIEFFEREGEKFKVELIKDLKENKVSIYKHNDFVDLCKGPHLNSTKEVKYFKLLSTSGAYWRGEESNPQLVRIYGTAFYTEDELNSYLKNLEEAKRRDHRILGRELDLVDIYHNEAGAGLVFYQPKGALLRRIIEDWEIKEHLRRGYKMVITPHIMDKKLWIKSGHLEYYQEYMYSIDKDNQSYILKPMNCPGHILIYKSKLHSWRDLPLRLFELGTVYRYEKSGVLHGLLRVRGFTQDDAHIFCKKDDLYSEIENVLDFVKYTMVKFGFEEFFAELSTRPEKFIGEKEDWENSEKILEKVLKNKGFSYVINKGEGAFYGPKIDIKLKDALGRQWQCATVQLDYNMPKRFQVTYRDANGREVLVAMVHRVILGSIERFIATLIEHYGGRFPFWLAPIQIIILNITREVKDYAYELKDILEKENFRVDVDSRDETLQKKIRENEQEKIPYIVILGKKEKENKKVSVRKRGGIDLGVMGIEEAIGLFKKEREEKKEV